MGRQRTRAEEEEWERIRIDNLLMRGRGKYEGLMREVLASLKKWEYQSGEKFPVMAGEMSALIKQLESELLRDGMDSRIARVLEKNRALRPVPKIPVSRRH